MTRRASIGLGIAVLLTFSVLCLISVPPARAAVPTFDDTKIYQTEGEFTRAIAVYQRALAGNPSDVDASFWLGVAYWTASVLSHEGVISYGGDYLRRAIVTLEQTVRLDPKHIGAWLLLGQAYDSAGDTDRAAAAFERLIILGPDPSLAVRGVPPPSPPHRPIGGRPAPSAQVQCRMGGLYTFSCSTLPPV